ncbi:hypothetical protein ACFE04_017110 [Oxalis oulophora]
MAKEGGGGGSSEWRIKFPGGTSANSMPEIGLFSRILLSLKKFLVEFVQFLRKAKNVAVAEPEKVMHGLKVGLALSFVSLFYFMRPLYDGVGGNAMWAIVTVVVVFESTVGATLSKCVNRTLGTFLAGLLGIGVHWIANESGHQLEPIILGISVFLFASAATFSRFMPSVKARFDYGALIFILTFSLVSVSGYRTDKLVQLAWHRLSTIAIGTSLCIFISMVICPIWAGTQLHHLTCHNLVKLSDSLEECVTDYFKDNETITSVEDPGKQMQGYKCVLNSKATEDSMASFAIWEPAHGCFNFRHPWKQYLKIAASMRSSAYCIETLSVCINSETQAQSFMKKQLKNLCIKLCSSSSNVLKELAITLKSMTKSSKMDFLPAEMNFAVQELRHRLKSLPNKLIHLENDITKTGAVPSLVEILQVVTVVSLLIENAAKIEGIIDAVNELASLAEFKPTADEKIKQNREAENQDNQEHETIEVDHPMPSVMVVKQIGFGTNQFMSRKRLEGRGWGWGINGKIPCP